MLVTMQQVKDHLNIDHSVDDAKLTEIARQASDTMLDYLKRTESQLIDSGGVESDASPGEINQVVIAATLKVAAALYENRDGSPNATPALSQDVKDMVHRHRDPAFA